MWTADTVVDALRKRGELWEPVPGLVSLRGGALALLKRIERIFEDVAEVEGFPEWRLAPGLDLHTLARSQYFESFPQWLTAAGHLSGDPAALEAIARSENPADAAAQALEPAECALSPALCYHTYARLTGATVDRIKMSAHGTCWRHEGERLLPLERGWAFTMHELVLVGDAVEVAAFRADGIELGQAIAHALGLECEVVPATDPFFAPTARGKTLLQQIKGLKHELRLDIGGGRSVAAASFNDHEHFFGESFDIRQRGGGPAASGCVAFGVERWVLAFLVAHGPDASGWPDTSVHLSTAGRRVR